MKRAALAASVITALVAVVALVAPPASAHAELITSTPVDGATLDVAPTEVDLTFSDDLMPETVAVSVLPDGGSPAALAPLTIDGGTVTVPWPVSVTSGPVVIAYRVVSADGHPVEGSISLTIAGEATTAPTTAPGASTSVVASEPATTSTPTTPSPDGSRIPPLAWVSLGLAVGIAIGFAFYLRRRRTP